MEIIKHPKEVLGEKLFEESILLCTYLSERDLPPKDASVVLSHVLVALIRMCYPDNQPSEYCQKIVDQLLSYNLKAAITSVRLELTGPELQDVGTRCPHETTPKNIAFEEFIEELKEKGKC